MNREHTAAALRSIAGALDPQSLGVLSDLARLYVCLEWAERDQALMSERPAQPIHLVVDADVAVNWAYPDEQRSMTKIFGNEHIAHTLSEVVGDCVFVAEHRKTPPPRMFQGHAAEINGRVGSSRRESARKLKALKNRIARRERPLTRVEQDEIRAFVEETARESGLEVSGEGLRALSPGSDDGGRNVTPKRRLTFVLQSSKVEPMSQEWVDALVGSRPIEADELSARYEHWRDALRACGGKEGSDEADAAALTYVDLVNARTRVAEQPCLVVFLTGTQRIFRAQLLSARSSQLSRTYIRHPLCFLFERYSLDQTTEFDSSEWATYKQIFGAFLLRQIPLLDITEDDLFEIAYQLAFTDAASAHAGTSRNSALVADLLGLRETCEQLATARALSLRAEQQNQQSQGQSAASPARQGPAPEAGAPLPPELELLIKLRWLETAILDSMLLQLVGSGVLSNSLAIGSNDSPRMSQWRKVPVVIIGTDDDELQRFAISLRQDPPSSQRAPALLREAREKASKSPSGYMALVIDALVLAAFGEWSAAASMAERAIGRAGYFLRGSATRATFDRLSWRENGAERREALEEETADIDGREARYLCVYAIRYSARSLADYEEAGRHLRAFESLAEFGDPRPQSERLALSLAEWSFIKYTRGQSDIGFLRSLLKRLEATLSEIQRYKQMAAHDHSMVHWAVGTHSWEQSTINQAITLLEFAEEDEEIPSSTSNSLFPDALAEWVFASEATSSQFSRFIASVSCVVFAPQRCEALSKLSLSDLLAQIEEFAEATPKDGIAHERQRARAYRSLARSRAAGVQKAR